MHQGGALERLTSLGSLPIGTDQEPHFHVAFELAVMYTLSFYDALYLELAKRRRSVLATLDERLARAATAEGVEFPNM